MTTQLAFRSTQFNTVYLNKQLWFTSTDLASALEYKSTKSITNLYNQNSDEFSSGMSQVTESVTSGNYRKKVRVFSLRGAHLIAMFARTDVAKEFRRWVLDILDREAGSQTIEPSKPKPRQSTAKQLIPLRQTAERLIATGMGNIYPDIWKLVHQRFDVEHIHQLPPDQIGEAIEYLDTLEGEYIGKQNSLPANIRLTEKEIIRLAWLWDSSNRSRDLFRQLHPALKDLRSEFSSKAYDHANEFGYIIEETRKIIIGLIDEMPLPSNLWDCDKLVLERIRRNSLPF